MRAAPGPGPIALHGGGEFLPGDEPFLRACLEAALPAARARSAACAPARTGELPGDDPGTVRVVVVPAAAAGQRPELAAAHGTDAFRRVAGAAAITARVEAALVVDAASAASSSLAARLAGADLVHLPGGDPGRILAILDGSPAWRAILAAHARGAVLAGASAGAMALASWSWTPGGWRRGLGLLPGLIVVPHAEPVGRSGRWEGTFGAMVPPEAGPVGRLGLDERTGVLQRRDADGRTRWQVVGAGQAHWSRDAATPPRSAGEGELLDLPG